MFFFNPWVETALVALLAVSGICLARWFSRRRSAAWTLGYLLPFGLLIVFLAIGYSANCNRRLEFVFPFSWLMGGRAAFAALAFITTMVLTTPLLKLPRPRERTLLTLLMMWFVWQVSIWPFLAPVFNQDSLAALRTVVDVNGVCMQSTDYTCGPASAVTSLRRLGLRAEESELSTLARTTRALGTPPAILCRVLQHRYQTEGLACEYRPFQSIEELRMNLPTLAVMKFGFMTDHYVAVLEVTEDRVVVGDPLQGKRSLTYREFMNQWRQVGIVLRRGRMSAGR